MRITFDPAKNDGNIAERGLSFELMTEFEWESPLTVEDTRRDYGERRLQVMALLKSRLHVAVITLRGDAVHVISFRKANRKEVNWYEQEKA